MWSSVSERAGWCCGWLQRQRRDSWDTRTAARRADLSGACGGQPTPALIPHGRTVDAEGVSVCAGEAATALRQREAGLPRASSPLSARACPGLLTAPSKSVHGPSSVPRAPTSGERGNPRGKALGERLGQPHQARSPSPFVLSWPLLSSAPSMACPSAAKRSFRVSISLRTENKKVVFKDVRHALPEPEYKRTSIQKYL